jgi:hypothetical protein
MDDATQALTRMATNLAIARFKVLRDVMLPDGSIADLVASRTLLSWKGLTVLSQHVFVRSVDSASHDHLKALFESGFRFGKKTNRLPLLRGMQFGYMIIPVILTRGPDSRLIESAIQRPAKHWALFEFPVVVDLASRRAAFYQGGPAWGGLFFSDLRNIIDTLIAGITTGPLGDNS